jgi:hypothetical protein
MSVNTTREFRRLHGTHRLYRWAAIVAALLVFSGFARTYYLKSVFQTPALPTLVLVHGFVMSAWFVLFATQTWLVEARRVDIHRRLGMLGAIMVVLMPVLGVATAIEGARRHAGPPGIPPLAFLVIPIFDITMFAIFAGAGLLLRRRSDFHRRLMLLATLGILAAAIARVPLDFIRHGGPVVFFGLTDVVILACVSLDTIRHRRLHPAFGWGTALLIVMQPAGLLLSGTTAWMHFAGWLVG